MPEPAQNERRTGERRFPHLQHPPITEVVCGLMFDSIPALDPFEFGVYWDRRRDEYPEKALHPALLDELDFDVGGLLSMRAWLVSKSGGELLQQIQHDRFYMNWRRREGIYPHFNDSEAGEGLKTIALREFDALTKFCVERRTIGSRPKLRRVELTKIDTFTRGHEWATLEELAFLLPVTSAFTAIRQSEQIQISLSEREKLPGGWLAVQINSSVDGAGNLMAVRLEARVSRSLDGERTAEGRLTAANELLNRVFFELVPAAEERFGVKEVEE